MKGDRRFYMYSSDAKRDGTRDGRNVAALPRVSKRTRHA